MCLGNRFFRPRKFWSPAPQGIFDSSGAPQGSVFWAHVWPGDTGFEFLRARSACAPKGSKFRWGAAITHFWKGASHRGPLTNWSVPTNSGRSYSPHSINGGSKSEPPFGWGNLPAIHINGPCLHCTKSSDYVFLEPFARSEPKKSNPVSQGKDDASNNSNPRGFRKGVVNRDPLSIKASPTPHGRWRRRRCDEFSCQVSPNLALALPTTGLR